VREGCYNEEGVPRRYDSFPAPAVRVDGADVQIGNHDARAKLIHKFKVIQPKTGGDNDITLEVRFRMHFAGDEPLTSILEDINKTTFVLGLNARQEDLQFGGEDADEEEDEEAEPDCVDCANNIPYAIGSKTIHASGQPCTAVKKDSGPSLAPAAIVGGTHQKKKGRVAADVQ